jgi:hypothetical protein
VKTLHGITMKQYSSTIMLLTALLQVESMYTGADNGVPAVPLPT